MKKINKIISFFVVFAMLITLNVSNAYTVEIDPDSLISFPMLISNGEGTITIYEQGSYTLYYQAVEMSDSDYDKLEKLQNDGEKYVDEKTDELKELKAEVENLETAAKEKKDAYEKLLAEAEQENENLLPENKEPSTNDGEGSGDTGEENGEENEAGDGTATENEELTKAKTEYETALKTYTDKLDLYNDEVEKYNSEIQKFNDQIKAIIPGHDENLWIKTENREFKVDRSKFTGKKGFVVWAKLVDAKGNISYDQAVYTVTGTKVDNIAVESIKLNKTEVTMTEGSTYTLVATVSPSDATNKIVTWSSSNTNVATVIDGKVTALSAGNTTITAKTSDGNLTVSCKVTVNKKAVSGSNQGNEPKDQTVADKILPATGNWSYVIIITMVVLGIFGIFTHKRIKYLSGK